MPALKYTVCVLVSVESWSPPIEDRVILGVTTPFVKALIEERPFTASVWKAFA
jgi:hypothetical protein